MRFIWVALAALASGCETLPAPAQGTATEQGKPAEQANPGEEASRSERAPPGRRKFRPAPVSPQRDDPSPGDTTPEPTDSGSRALVDKARSDLMKRLGVPADQVHFLSYRSVVWPNAGFGCPKPGMAYTQVPKDGALIRLAAQGQTYSYHSGGGRDPFLCTNPQTSPETKAPPPGDRI